MAGLLLLLLHLHAAALAERDADMARLAPHPCRMALLTTRLPTASTSPTYPPRAQVVVTATRNQAIDAVVQKLSRVEGSLLVFGRKERLGPNAERFLLEERVARHPHVAAWLEHVRQLQELRDGTGFLSCRAVLRLLRAMLAPVSGAGTAGRLACLVEGWKCRTARLASGSLLPGHQSSSSLSRAALPLPCRPTAPALRTSAGCSTCWVGWSRCAGQTCLGSWGKGEVPHWRWTALAVPAGAGQQPRLSNQPTPQLACPVQGNYSDLDKGILQPAVSLILATILPAVKAAVKRIILETTRVYACTIDSTPRMVGELREAKVSAIGGQQGRRLQAALEGQVRVGRDSGTWIGRSERCWPTIHSMPRRAISLRGMVAPCPPCSPPIPPLPPEGRAALRHCDCG